MNTTDPIADFLTRIRNAAKANHKVVEIPASNMKKKLAEVMYDQGFIRQYKFEDDNGPQGTIKIALKYNSVTRKPVITEMKRASRPGLRIYTGSKDFPRVRNGLGIAIVSTSKGIMTAKQAAAQNVGGEVLCYIF